MRWILITCILLATTTNVLSRHRSKRDLSYIKNLILSKLFGTETIYIQQPEIPKNETNQLFKIKGYDNILVKVTRKRNEATEGYITHNKEKIQVPVIVDPETAIIGSYLGTTTQGETLLAIEIAKNLIRSGILNTDSDKLIHDLAESSAAGMPYKYNNADEFNFANRDAVSGKLGLPKVNPKHAQTKYFYTQQGNNAHVTYESYNNKDVIVTRTEKQPPLPQYLKLRFSDLASVDYSPYNMKYQQPDKLISEQHVLNVMPHPYSFLSPAMAIQENIQPNAIPSYVLGQYSAGNPSLGHIDYSAYAFAKNPTMAVNNPALISQLSSGHEWVEQSKPNLKFDIRDHYTDADINKINKFINDKLNQSKNDHRLSLVNSSKDLHENETKSNSKDDNLNNILSKKVDSNNVLVSQYLYKQINHNSNDNFTVVKVENQSDRQHADQTINTGDTNNVIKDFVFMPPKDIDVPLPSMIPKTKNINDSHKSNKDVLNHDLASSETSVHSLKETPIIVVEDNSSQNKNTFKTFKRRKPSFKPYSGGPVF